MRKSNWAGPAFVAIVLLILVVMAVHITPVITGVMAPILLGIAAVVTAVRGRGNPPPKDGTDTDSDPGPTADNQTDVTSEKAAPEDGDCSGDF